MLTSDLDSEEERDKSVLDALLMSLTAELEMSTIDVSDRHCRTLNHEVQLVIMRLLSVLMSRTKAGTKSSSEVTFTVINIDH